MSKSHWVLISLALAIIGWGIFAWVIKDAENADEVVINAMPEDKTGSQSASLEPGLPLNDQAGDRNSLLGKEPAPELSGTSSSRDIEKSVAVMALDADQSTLQNYLEALYPSSENENKDEIGDELASWVDFCENMRLNSIFARGKRKDINERDRAFLEQVDGFCSNYSQLVEKYLDTEFDDELVFIEQVYPELELLEGEQADRFIARELDRVLEQGVFSEVVALLAQRVVPFLSERISLTGTSDWRITQAVAVYLICQRHGCGPTNALVLRLCYNLEIYCNRPPRDLLDALEQSLSGAEFELFNEALADVQRLLASVD